jgi:hypothetical protein
MERYCPCGKQIRVDRRLCKECADIYGIDKQEWPEWLSWMVSDIQRELDFDRNHEYSNLDEIEPNGRGGYRAKPVFTLRGCRELSHVR